MRKWLAISALTFGVACGGATQHMQIQEVPIDQASTSAPSDLPPDEVGGDSGVAAYGDATAPPGVGPQSIDTQPDASTQASAPPAFVQRAGGLTLKECSDVVMVLAKSMTKENHVPTPTSAELAQHPIFGQMLAECGQSTTKKQHKCAMASRTTAAWKKCME
jgi:hypothetical protein